MEQSVSETATGNKPSVTSRMRSVLAVENPSAVQTSLCNIHQELKATRDFVAHPPRKEHIFAAFKRDTLRNAASPATSHNGGSARPPAVGLWKCVNVKG